MSRTTKSQVQAMFKTYCRAAGNLGYDTSEWSLKITNEPLVINASKGPVGPDALEPLPGLVTTFIGMRYVAAHDVLATAALTMQAIANDRPQTKTRGLFRYEVHGRYGTHHIDLMYDINRDGSYTELYEPSIEVGSRKAMSTLAMKFNQALHADPTEPIRTDDNVRYLPHD